MFARITIISAILLLTSACGRHLAVDDDSNSAVDTDPTGTPERMPLDARGDDSEDTGEGGEAGGGGLPDMPADPDLVCLSCADANYWPSDGTNCVGVGMELCTLDINGYPADCLAQCEEPSACVCDCEYGWSAACNAAEAEACEAACGF